MISGFFRICVFLGLTLFAYAKPAWTKDLTAPKFGPHPIISPTKLTYSLSWKGTVKSGTLIFELNKPDKRYPQYHIGQIYGGSTGFARKLYPYDGNFVSFLDRKTLWPRSFTGKETDRREVMESTNRYTRKAMTSQVKLTALTADGKTGVESDAFTFPDQLDALSAMYFIRSQPLKQGDALKIVIHPFQSPYLARVTVLGREKHLGEDAIKLSVLLQKIRKSLKLKSYKKMKRCTLWISDDSDRVPLELRTEVFIGDVRMTLQKKERL